MFRFPGAVRTAEGVKMKQTITSFVRSLNTMAVFYVGLIGLAVYIKQ
jgi:hypothetical protein